jgi:hypothetical protein
VSSWQTGRPEYPHPVIPTEYQAGAELQPPIIISQPISATIEGFSFAGLEV